MVIISPNKYHSNTELTIYEFYGDDGEQLGKIPGDTDFIVYAESGIQGDEISNLYVEYNEIKGWIKSTYSNYKYVENLDIEITPEQPTKEEPTKVEPNKKENPYEFAIKWGVIGLTVVLTSIVIIVLINRSKKDK